MLDKIAMPIDTKDRKFIIFAFTISFLISFWISYRYKTEHVLEKQ